MAKPACVLRTVKLPSFYRQKGALTGRVAGGDVHNSGNEVAQDVRGAKGGLYGSAQASQANTLRSQ